MARTLDPRRSLAAAATGLIVALAVTFSITAAVWVGGIARQNVLEQHVRRLLLETDQLSSDLAQTVSAHLGAVRTAGDILRASEVPGRHPGLSDVFDELVSAYPQFDWIAIADPAGRVVNANRAWPIGQRVNGNPWFDGGRRGTWIGVIEDMAQPAQHLPVTLANNATALGDIALPVRDDSGSIVGVIAARLSWHRTPNHPRRLTDEGDSRSATQAYVLNSAGVVLVGPAEMLNKPWNGVPLKGADTAEAHSDSWQGSEAAPQFERLPGGRLVLVSRAPLNTDGELARLGLRVQLIEPKERVYLRADAVSARIFWVSLCLGAATALAGTLGARHLTRRLQLLTLSVASFGRSDTAKIEVPPGRDEVAQLGAAFSKLIDELEQERSELESLSNELERRVAVRTSEVERLAEESRYAAIVRERLKIARDLHDTLAHSIMAILSEIRYIRRIHTHDPASMSGELARAEDLAHEGLVEARSAITQMRVNAVRETGLGPALSNAFERFVDHTGLAGEFSADTGAARFGDDRAETLLRIAQEALRNVERHARATRVNVTLRATEDGFLTLLIEDNGIGFDTSTLHTGHFGLVGLREQAELIGAQLRIDSKPDEGTTICVALSLSPIEFGRNS
jgi:signal transduction histidine kinase